MNHTVIVNNIISYSMKNIKKKNLSVKYFRLPDKKVHPAATYTFNCTFLWI